MVELLGQSDAVETVRRLIFVGGLWSVFWGVAATAALASVLWLVIVDGMVRGRFGLNVMLKAIACLSMGIGATALCIARVDVGGAGVVVMGAAVAGLVIYLYTLERRLVSGRTGAALTGLRLGLVVVLFAMMAEPVATLSQTETKKRWLAVLADNSVSMDVVDRHMPAGRRLRFADALGMLNELARPIRLEADAIELRWIAGQMQPHLEWLEEVVHSRQRGDKTTATMAQRRKSVHKAALALTRRVERVADVLSTVLEDRQTIPRDSVGDIVDLRSRLDSQVIEPLKAFVEQLGTAEQFDALTADEVGRLIEVYEKTVQGLLATSESLTEAGERLDEAFARQADAETRHAMDQVGRLSRREVAARLLGGEGNGLVGRLADDVNVRYYVFARSSRAMGPDKALAELRTSAQAERGGAIQPATTMPTATNAATRPVASAPTAPADDGGDARTLTDLAGAIQQVVRDLPPEDLGGLVVLSDGQHGGEGDPVEAAKALGAQDVGIFPVVLGARQAPTDAAIVKLDVANVVHTDDTMDVLVSVSLDGLAGRSLKIRLMDEEGRVLDLQDQDEQGRAVERDAPLKTKTLTAGTDHERQEVRLSHKPARKGRHVFRVVLDTPPEEVFKENNERVFAVDVTEERTKVLIVDGLPRWEFRYLRNLLARDESVLLQYVLFDPALIARQPEMRQVPARVTNASPEADRLPEEAEDLNAFDVIVLGDVGSDDLPRDKQKMIEQFVSDRGGALVVVAGKRQMPTDYADQPLRQVLPVTFEQDASALGLTAGGLGAERFRLQLTSEGLHHMVAELAVEPEANRALWEGLPPMQWRSPVCMAKGGSQVLAWARVAGASPAAPATPSTGRARTEPQADPQRRNGLLIAQNYGLGKVLYIGWDATWRFRYKHGDMYHHKFWGQVLRWATAGKLPTGLKLVKIGTNKARYTDREGVVVRAKFTRPDFTPMADAEVRAVVRQGQQTITTVRLNYVAGSPGMYEGTITGLSPGKFRVVLDSPQIEALRQADDPPGEVATTIVVEVAQSSERLELAANTQLMTQLADASGGIEIIPSASDQLAEHVRTEPAVEHIHQQVTVWDKWWLLAVFSSIVGAEWILRKRAGLM